MVLQQADFLAVTVQTNGFLHSWQNQTFGFKPSLGEDGRNATQYVTLNAEGGSGAGSGYFGGTTIKDTVSYSNAAGSAGSSYISGHKGCVQHPNTVFMQTKLISGLELMNLPNGI